MAPTLSVVVPFYNVDLYLAECLAALSGQSFVDMEIICVDDGSDDGSSEIVRRFSAVDDRFRVIQQGNQGPGAAKNTGVRVATGQYLAFVDGDDIVARDAFETLVGSLRATGSDIACGAVHRFDATGSRPSWLHAEVFTTARSRTHIRRHPQLAVNRTVWNQVYRRSFWDAHRFEFAETLYEDVMVAVPTHVLATAVDVLTDVVYFWRERGPGEPPSITQLATEPENAIDRMVAVERLGRCLRQHAPEARLAHDRLVVNRDLRVMSTALRKATSAQRTRLIELARSCLRDIEDSALAELFERDRSQYDDLIGSISG